MKVLTLTQPYATLIAVGAKSIETRSWGHPEKSMPFPIAIHAAKGMDQGAFQVLWEEGPIADALCQAGVNPYTGMVDGHPGHKNWSKSSGERFLVRKSGAARAMMETRGKVVAYATVKRTISVTMNNLQRLMDDLPEKEFDFGYIDNGRVLWMLEDVEAVKEPYSLRGAQRLWPFLVDPDSTAADYIRRHGFDFEQHKY